MEWIIFALTVPVFYIMGLVSFIRWLAHHGKATVPESQPDLGTAAAEIRLRAAQYEGKVKEELLAAADSLDAPLPLTEDVDTATARYEPGKSVPSHTHTIAHNVTRPHPAPAKQSWASADISDAIHSLDNINLILFLGAFLVVASAGIFVGYNFETLSGWFKTGFLGLFAAIFYATGLTLYLRAPKLRPAGSTFTGIGLIMLPLVGLAAYNFTSAHDHARGLWFITSLITLCAYIATLAFTRQTYVAYLMAFTTLSLFESSISLINMPLYWFGWGMGLVALLLLVLSRWTGWWRDAAQSLSISANLFVPLSAIFSLGLTPDQGVTQLGVTFGMAGVFYGYLSTRPGTKPQTAEVYWLLALLSLPAALGIGLWDTVSHAGIAAILVAIGAGYFALDLTSSAGLASKWRQILGLVAGLLPIAAAILQYDKPTALLGYLLAATAINAAFAWRLREGALALIAILAALVVPVVLLRQVASPSLGWGWVAAGYLALTAVMVWWRRAMSGWAISAIRVGQAGYLLSIGSALITAAVSGHLAIMLIAFVASATLFWLSYYEHSPEFIYIASAVKYLAFLQIIPLTGWPDSAYAIVIILLGSLSYILGYTMEDQERGQALRYSSIVATLGGALFGASGESLSPIASFALGGALLLAEARRQVQPIVEDAAIAILILAFNWFLGYNHVDQTQLYSIPWAGYFAYLGYQRRHLGRAGYDVFTILALFALTVPIAGQALGENGALYGLELIFIGLGLVIAGAAMRYKLVSWWGAGTLIVEVLYQMREVLYALPKYLISAALGLALLGAAIVMLQRRKDH